jgi:cell wall-associated NlpC family hydrolase
MLWLVKNAKGKMVYTQSHPARMIGVIGKLKPPKWPKTADCSALATWAYYASGLRDPNGLGFNGYGYTGTMQSHGVRVPLSKAKPGDCVFYSNPDHVAIYVGNGRVVGFGHQGGPDNDPVNYRPVTEVRRYV